MNQAKPQQGGTSPNRAASQASQSQQRGASSSPNASPTTKARFRTIADQDDRLWQIIDGFLARLKESPPLRAITPAQLNALLNHTQGNSWKGLCAFVQGQVDKDKRNRLAGEKEGKRPDALEGRYEKFWQQIQKTLDGEIKDLRAGLSEEKDRALARVFATALVAKMRMELLLNPGLYVVREASREREGR